MISEADSATPTEALTAVVTRLRAEVAGLRGAMKHRAVIEQAKGVLVERLGISPDQSFDRLVQISQRTNIKLVEVAAAIVGTTAPGPPTPGRPAVVDDAELSQHIARSRSRVSGRRSPQPRPPTQVRAPAVEALQSHLQLVGARISAATGYDEIAAAIADPAAGWPAPNRVTIVSLEPDGAMRIVGAHGLTAEIRSQWLRIPPDPNLPIVEAVHNREIAWLPDAGSPDVADEPARQWPYSTGGMLAAPLVVDDRLLGGLLLTWTEPLEDNDDLRRYLTALTGPVARRVDGLLGDALATAWEQVQDTSSGGSAHVWLPSVLDTMRQPALMLAPIYDEQPAATTEAEQPGQLVDFQVEYANTPAREVLTASRIDLNHATLLALYPNIGAVRLLGAFGQLLRDGAPVRLSDVLVTTRSGRPSNGHDQRLSVHAVRLWDRVLMVFELTPTVDHPDAPVTAPAAALARPAGDLAAAILRTPLPADPAPGHVEPVGTWTAAPATRWYDVIALPDGGSVLVLGEVDGDDLTAVRTATMIRYSVAGYAWLDMSPAEILTTANSLLSTGQGSRAANLTVARHRPLERTLQWAGAGATRLLRHPRGGPPAERLTGPGRPPLGTSTGVHYRNTTVSLADDDQILVGYDAADTPDSLGLRLRS